MPKHFPCFAPTVFVGLLTAGQALAQPDPKLEPTFGSVSLKAGFSPDPFKKDLPAGGVLQTNLGGVNAHVAKAPDYRLIYTRGQSPLTIGVKSAGGTTLLIHLPDGKWVANADGLRGQITFNAPQSGRYDIYLGTIGKDNLPATLFITESPVAPLIGKGNLPDCYLLAAGVDHFRGAQKLRGCLNDARDVTAAFRAQKGILFRNVEHETLLAESATRNNILTKFQSFSDRGAAGDYFVLYLAGHGGINNSDRSWFYTPFNFDVFRSFDTALTDEQILSAADKLVRQNKKVVIIIDACHSGLMADSAKLFFERYKGRKAGGIILALSCGAAQVSANAGENGAFTRAFAEAMKSKGDLNKDGKITLGEIQDYTFRRTSELLTQTGSSNTQTSSLVWSSVFARDTVLSTTGTLPVGAKSFEPPTLPRGFGNARWDVSALEERCTIVGCTIESQSSLVFVLDLKEDIPQRLRCKLVLLDGDGVKSLSWPGHADPQIGKRGGRIRLTFPDVVSRLGRRAWANATHMKLVLE